MAISRRGFLGLLAAGMGAVLVEMRLSHAAPTIAVDPEDPEDYTVCWHQMLADDSDVYVAHCLRDAHGNQITPWSAPMLLSEPDQSA